MELINIIELTIFLFSGMLLMLLALSYLFYRIKNRTTPAEIIKVDKKPDQIHYESPKKEQIEELKKSEIKKPFNGRFLIINEILRETLQKEIETKKSKTGTRYYRYYPNRSKKKIYLTDLNCISNNSSLN